MTPSREERVEQVMPVRGSLAAYRTAFVPATASRDLRHTDVLARAGVHRRDFFRGDREGHLNRP